ncbi:MAG: sialate O-acetylesterase, partial [Planctomycetota bacterium]
MSAEVRLPALFGDHMVLQRDMPLPVWGWASPGESVKVTLGDASATATTSDDGAWRVTLPARSAARGLELIVSANQTLTFSDVAIGEVWVCSGQSNMQWNVGATWNGDLEIVAADQPDIRLISVHNPGSQSPVEDFPGAWECCTPEAARQFSAVGYYFGKRLQETLGVPVGLIDNAWGGSACGAWTPREAMAADAVFKPTMDWWASQEKDFDEAADLAAFQKRLDGWERAVDRAKASGARAPERPNPRRLSLANRR